ncbi:MAG: hypothetical protein LBP22_13545 [Deltaproteobacteria bacterium]|nr:hypothetical protein [Deltaproteobacteria bacterium]
MAELNWQLWRLHCQAAISLSGKYLTDDGGTDIAGSSLGLAVAQLADSKSRGLAVRELTQSRDHNF